MAKERHVNATSQQRFDQLHNGNLTSEQSFDQLHSGNLTSQQTSNQLHNGRVMSNGSIETNDDTKKDCETEWEPPDGGYGWVIVGCSFMLFAMFASYSQIGIFLLPLTDYFQVSKTTISAINSVQACTGRILGVFIGQMLQRFGARWVVGCGVACITIGYFSSSFVDNIPLLFLTYGFLPSLGFGCYFSTGGSAAQQFFTKKRSLASGITMAGISAGVFAWSPFGTYLLEHFGLQRTFQIESGVHLGVGIILVLLLRPAGNIQPCTVCQKKKPSGGESNDTILSESSSTPSDSGQVMTCGWARKFCNFSLVKNPALLLYWLGTWLAGFGHQTNNNYLPVRGELIGLPKETSAFQTSAFGIAGGIATPIWATVGNIPGVRRLFMAPAGMLLIGCFTLASTVMTSSTLLLVNAALSAISGAMYISVTFTILCDLVGTEHIAVASGLHSAVLGFTHLILHPTAGYLLDVTDNPQAPFYLAGTASCLASVTVALVNLVQKEQSKKSFGLHQESSQPMKKVQLKTIFLNKGNGHDNVAIEEPELVTYM